MPYIEKWARELDRSMGGDEVTERLHRAQREEDGMGEALEIHDLGGQFVSGPAAVLQTGGRLVVFGRGTDNAVWHRWQVTRNGEWSGAWESLGGVTTSDPGCALNAPGGLVVFVRGTDNAIHHRWQEQPDGEWSGWESLGGQWTSGPSAVLLSGKRLSVLARGLNSRIWQRSQTSANGDWGPWTDFGVASTADPDVTLDANGSLAVFALSAKGSMVLNQRVWQPDPPPPTVLTTVPPLVGALDIQVPSLLAAARLRVGLVWNPTGEIRGDHLRVVAQDPAAGSRVPVNTGVGYTVALAQPVHGIKSVVLANQHQNRRAVEVFVADSVAGAWNSKGTLGFGTSITLSLESGRVYTIVAVDRGLVNCTNGRPDNVSCQRLRWSGPGDSEGDEATLVVSSPMGRAVTSVAMAATSRRARSGGLEKGAALGSGYSSPGASATASARGSCSLRSLSSLTRNSTRRPSPSVGPTARPS